MSHFLCAIPYLASVFSADPSIAQKKQTSSISDKASSQKASVETESSTSFLQLGANYTHLNFQFNGETSNGNLGGLQGSYDYFSDSCYYAGVRLNWRQGDNGMNHNLLYIDTQEIMGYSLHWNAIDSIWTFFSGLGYRHLDLGAKTEFFSSFSYNTFYVPVGIATNYRVNSWFSFHLNLTWMPQIFPTVWIDSLRGINWSLTKKLANFMVEVPFDFTVSQNRRWHVVVTPFYEYWQDGHATTVTLILPQNTYKFYGVNINAAYSF
ncbi:MAG: hypothetical protein HYZ48_04250 [Chlamydiales bacterium]|nr:hypothetical protein [Chlamydiales bacterium]